MLRSRARSSRGRPRRSAPVQGVEKFAKAGVPVGMRSRRDSRAQRRPDGSRARAREGRRCRTAGWVLLRLPGASTGVRGTRPAGAAARGRKDPGPDPRDPWRRQAVRPRWHARGRGEGVYAQTISTMFDTTVKRLGLDARDERYLPSCRRGSAAPKQRRPSSRCSDADRSATGLGHDGRGRGREDEPRRRPEREPGCSANHTIATRHLRAGQAFDEHQIAELHVLHVSADRRDLAEQAQRVHPVLEPSSVARYERSRSIQRSSTNPRTRAITRRTRARADGRCPGAARSSARSRPRHLLRGRRRSSARAGAASPRRRASRRE